MPDRLKILLLDDEPGILELYKQLLAELPSRPEIHTASTGARAIAMLNEEPFSLFLLDLNMPGMDGLQVLAIVRRKFPHLRTVVMTALADEQFRHRAYALGLDLYLEKPTNAQGTKLFFDCIEGLLGQNVQDGFRGIQSKSLVDIIQLEALCQSSAVIKIRTEGQEGRIWFQNGDIIDAATSSLIGEPAFRQIIAWKTGNFEMLPADPNRPRQIQMSCQRLLLESAQAVDESQSQSQPAPGTPTEAAPGSGAEGGIAALSRIKGVEFLLMVSGTEGQPTAAWSLEEPAQVATWTKQTLAHFRALGDMLQAGELTQFIGYGMQHHVALIARGDQQLCVGLERSLTPPQLQETLNSIRATWAS